MGVSVPFRGRVQPRMDVVDLLEQALHAARRGHIQGVVLIPVNPLNEVETLFTGDLSPARSTALIGGLVRVAHKLTRET